VILCEPGERRLFIGCNSLQKWFCGSGGSGVGSISLGALTSRRGSEGAVEVSVELLVYFGRNRRAGFYWGEVECCL
jgi:hypothetical protein